MTTFQFGPFILHPSRRLLLRAGVPVTLTPKAFDTLVFLVRHRDRVVEKDELMGALWPDSEVEENNLVQAVSAIRKALGDSPTLHRAVATIPGRGYRFVADVTEVEDAATVPPEKRGRSEAETGIAGSATAESTRRDGVLVAGVVEGSVADPHPAASEVSHPRSVGGPAASKRWKLWSLAVIALGLGVGSVFVFPRRSAPPPAQVSMPSLAILPFRTAGQEDGAEYLGVGLADALITRLGNTRQIVVRPTSAVLAHAGGGRDAQDIGRDLRVDVVLDGTIRRDGERVRVTVQLVKVDNAIQIWGGTFDETFTHLFALEDSISHKVVANLTPMLTNLASALAPREAPSAEAYEAYLRGRYFREKITREGFEKGIENFENAISLAPDFAPAYAAMASCHCLLSGHGFEVETPDRAMGAAKAAAIKAFELDSMLPEAHAALGMVRLKYDWDYKGAEQALRRAIQLNPSYAEARLWYSIYLEAMGRSHEAVQEAERARDLDPLSLRFNVNVAAQYLRAGRRKDALEQIGETLELDANFWMAHWLLGDIRVQEHSYDDAVSTLEHAAALSDNNPAVLSSLGVAYAAAGRPVDARRTLEQLQAMGESRYVSPATPAAVCAALGDTDAAFEWLEKAYEQRSRSLVWLDVLPQFESLRTDPRFDNLLQRIGRRPG